jgi:insertion element IS1 protein InsB
MCEITIKVNCPHCFCSKVVKNGKKGNGSQNFLCKSCKKQFVYEYLYWGADPFTKRLAMNMLLKGSGIRDVAAVLKISKGAVVSTLLKAVEGLVIKPSKRFYHMVQIDEVYTFVKSKGKKVWLLYAYCAESDEILALTLGKRSKKTLKDLLKRLGEITVNFYCTDAWKVFGEVFDKGEHLIGKRFTKAIEGVNTSLRASCRRIHRRTTGFSKKVANHWAALRFTVWHRNTRASYI